jgi:hypothetical protein
MKWWQENRKEKLAERRDRKIQMTDRKKSS